MINPVTGLKKGEKKVREKFGSSKKVPTFAIPFETRGSDKDRKWQTGGSEKEGRKFLSMTKFIEKTEDKVQVASTETKIIESVDFF